MAMPDDAREWGEQVKALAKVLGDLLDDRRDRPSVAIAALLACSASIAMYMKMPVEDWLDSGRTAWDAVSPRLSRRPQIPPR
jgi:hypothetical protein